MKTSPKTAPSSPNSESLRPYSWLPLLSAIVVSAAFLPQVQAGASVLNSAATFAVLAHTTVTSTGPTVLNGNLGLTPGTAITGGPTVNGSTYTGTNAVAVQAMNDATSAYTTLAAETPTQNLSGTDLGNLILTNGVYE